MQVLITGASGFVGRHLITLLHERGHIVYAGIWHTKENFQMPINTVFLDLMDPYSLLTAIDEIKPDGIIHLAAQSMVKLAWKNPAFTFSANTIGTINLIEAIKRTVPNAKIITVGSSEEYGLSGKAGEPLMEEHPCLPQNPYAASKLAMGQVALQLAGKDNLNIIHVRPFNHFGPGQQEGYVVSDFASQIARIERGFSEPIIRVGDLTAKRDFTDVRDVVIAYTLLLENNVKPGIYNICSGIPHAINEILYLLMQKSKAPIEIREDKERIRPSEVPLFIGSRYKVQQATGWEPKRNFEESLYDTLQWWRTKVEN